MYNFPTNYARKTTLYFFEIRETLSVYGGLQDFRQSRMSVDYALKLA